MRRGWLHRVVEFDVGQLGPSDDLLLLLDRQGVPGWQVVQVLLHDHVATARVGRLLGTDQRGAGRRWPGRVLRPVHEAKQVSLVEVAEPVHLVHDRGSPVEPARYLGGQLKAQVHPPRPDVEHQVAGRAHGVPAVRLYLAERVQPRRPRQPRQPVPGSGAESGHAGQGSGEVAEPDSPDERRYVRAERSGRVRASGVGVEHGYQEDRGLGERRVDGLRLRTGVVDHAPIFPTNGYPRACGGRKRSIHGCAICGVPAGTRAPAIAHTR